MGYTTRDLAWYAAFIAGCSLTFLAMGAFGVESHMMKLLVSAGVGVALGVGAQSLVPKSGSGDGDTKRKDPRE